MSTESENIADLIKSYTDLKKYFETARDSIEQRIAEQNKRIDSFLQKPLVVQGADKKMYRIAMGQTSANDWQQYYTDGVVVTVDTSHAGFTQIPNYYTSLSGRTHHWTTQGATSIYNQQLFSFSIYINQKGLTVDSAKSKNWHIRWLAVGI
jgi:hypothetical protein